MLGSFFGLRRYFKFQNLLTVVVLLFLSGHWSQLLASTGALTQLSGTSGCVTFTGTNGCAQGRGLNGAGWVEVSGDGKYAYAASPNSSTVTTFSRNPATGALTQLPGIQGCIGDTGDGLTCAHGNGLSGAVSLALSPDGNQLYAVSRNNSLAIFSRNITTGVLTQLPGSAGCIADPGDGITCAQAHALGGPRTVTVSPDGKTVYVGARDGGAVAVFSRNLLNGVLTQLSGLAGCVSKDGTGGLCAQGPGLVGARGVFVSPDNRNVYVASEGDINGNSAVAVFSRNTTTGALTQLAAPAGCFAANGDGVTCTLAQGLVTAISSVVSPEGTSVYVAARDSSSLVLFSRNTTTGALTQLSGAAGCIQENGDGVTCTAGRGLNQVVFVRVSPDGTNVYAAAQVSNAVTIFSRNTSTGALTQLAGTAGCTSDGGTEACQTGRSLTGAVSLTVSPDAQHVYVAAYLDNLTDGAVDSFSRDAAIPPPCSLCVTAISPSSIDLGAPPASFNVTGAGFANTGFGLPLVDFSLNGFVLVQVRATALSGSTSLTVPFPVGLTSGTVDVQVFNQISANQSMFVGTTPLTVTGVTPGSGGLTQLSGISGCISDTGTGGSCTHGTGLNAASWLDISADGKFVYVASSGSSAVTTFSRNASTGALTQLSGTQGCTADGGDGVTCANGLGLTGAISVALSPDGNHVYVASAGNTVAVFSRNTVTGVLTQLSGSTGCIAETGSNASCANANALVGPRSITVSPDGTNVYVGARDGSAVVVFSRNATTGVLTQLTGTAGCVSSDGTGGLCTQGRALLGARGVIVSPDNKQVYVASQNDNAVAVFSRDTTTGALTQLTGTAGCISATGDGVTCAAGRGLLNPIELRVSPDGKHVYVASVGSSAIAAFSRDTTTGALTQLSGTAGCISETGDGVTCADGAGLGQVVFVTISPDGSNVYGAAQVSNAVTIFSRNPTTGVLNQLGGLQACVSSDGSGGSCAIGVALDGAISVVTSPDGKNVYLASSVGNAVLAFSRTANAPPTVVTAAAATPNPVTSTTTNLTVLGADDGGEVNLTYTWATTGTPPAPVTFSANGTNAAKSVVATFTKPGTYNFTVTITDTGGLTVTSSVAVTVNASLITTSVVLTSSLNPSNTNQPVGFTATVSAATSGTVSGTVTFRDGTASIGTGTLNASGQATLTTSTLAAGTHSITAVYAGNATFATSTSPAVNQVVNVGLSPTTTVLASAPNPSQAGGLVTFTATVSGPGNLASSNFPAPAENPLSEFGSWKSPVNPTSDVALQKNAAGRVFPTAVNKDSAARYIGKTVSGDQFSQATIAARGGSTVEGVLVRIQSNTSGSSYFFGSYYGAFYSIVRISDDNLEMHFVQNSDSFGGGRLLDINVAPQAGDVVRLEASGSPSVTLKAYRNGVLIGTVVDAGTSDHLGSYPSLAGGQPGLYAFLSSGQTTDTQLAAWSGGDLGAGAVPTGAVNFMEGTAVLGSGNLNAAGQVTYSTSTLATGTHAVTAVYAGNATSATSTSAAVNQVVNPAALTPTTTVLASAPNPSTIGQAVGFTATVAAGTGGTPAGTVNFLDGTTTIGSATLNASGQAIYSTSTLAAGPHSITAVYAGNASFATSTSTAVTQLVNSAALISTTTVVTSSLNPSTAGQPVGFTATVTAATGGTPAGSVNFMDGTNTIGSGTLNASGQAVFTTSLLAAGTHSITAVYAGNASFAASASAAVSQGVNPVPLISTTTVVTSSLNPATAGQPVGLTATVTATTGGTPAGTVNFVDGTTTIGSGTLNASGQASFTTSLLAAGTHSITAVYAGNATFATSTSAAVSEVVNPLTATTTVLVSSLNPANVGQSIGFTVTVTAATGGIPSGAVTFRDGTTSIGSGTLNASGQAVFTTSTLTAGTHPITAVYAGNAVFATSTSTAVTQLVNATGTSTATVVTSSVQPSTTGQAVTLRAAVTASSGSPSGTVTFMDGASPLGTGTLSGGAALLTTSALAAGFHIITAVYSGGGTFAGSASPILYQVVITRGQARSATILTSSSNPSTTGQNVSLAAAVTASGGYSASSTFDGAAQIPLSEGGRWTTPVNPATTLALQSDGNHHILVSGTDKPGVARYVGQVFLEDQFAQATISGRGGSTMEGVFVRMQSDTNPSAYGLVDFWGEWYSIARFDNNPGEYRLIQTSDAFNGGRLKDFAVVPKVGDVIRLEITGDTNPTLTAYVNGTLLGSVVDHGSSDWAGTYPPLAGGQPAVFLFKSGGSDIPEFSNWSTGDLGAPAGVAVPTGAVTFIDGTTVLGTATLNGAGQTTLDISTLSAGSYPIVAVYGGDAKYVGSSSPVLSQGVSGP